jgi:tripartite-type tricarboxylate transporter receptor subunit TctC
MSVIIKGDLRMNVLKSVGAFALASGIATVAASGQAAAQSAADFYKNKRVTVFIGYAAGGGYDRYGRVLAREIAKFIPGKPRTIAKNMPGAGSIVLANALYNTLPKDGTAIGIIGRGIAMEPLFGRKGPKFDATKFNWLGSMNNEVSTCVAFHTSGIKSIQDPMQREMILAATAQGSDGVDFALVLNNVIGTKFKLITGYPGGATLQLAQERGEAHGRCGWSWSSIKATRPQWIKEGKLKILVQLALKKHPEIPSDVPLIMDLAKTERDKKVLQLIFARQAMGRPFLAPPDVPADRVAALRGAFDAMVSDPGVKAMAKKTKLELEPVSGKEIEDMLKDIYSTPKDIVQAAADATQRVGKTKIEKKVIPIVSGDGKVTKTARGGRRITISMKGKEKTFSVSGSRTKVSVAGKKAKRSAIKPGMTCMVKWPEGAKGAKEMDCK